MKDVSAGSLDEPEPPAPAAPDAGLRPPPDPHPRPTRRPAGPSPATGERVVTAEIRNDVIVATEHIKASPEVVFPYFTDPALLVTWIGDRAELDPQPGGVFSLGMGQVTARGAYITVDLPFPCTDCSVLGRAFVGTGA